MNRNDRACSDSGRDRISNRYASTGHAVLLIRLQLHGGSRPLAARESGSTELSLNSLQNGAVGVA